MTCKSAFFYLLIHSFNIQSLNASLLPDINNIMLNNANEFVVLKNYIEEEGILDNKQVSN